jgi:hypothetical protein
LLNRIVTPTKKTMGSKGNRPSFRRVAGNTANLWFSASGSVCVCMCCNVSGGGEREGASRGQREMAETEMRHANAAAAVEAQLCTLCVVMHDRLAERIAAEKTYRTRQGHAEPLDIRLHSKSKSASTPRGKAMDGHAGHGQQYPHPCAQILTK